MRDVLTFLALWLAADVPLALVVAQAMRSDADPVEPGDLDTNFHKGAVQHG